MRSLEECKEWCEARLLGLSVDGIAAAVNDNVVGVGLGKKIVRSERTHDEAVRIYVRQKLPRLFLQPDHAIPAEIDGVPTDVVEVGEVSIWRPIPPIYQRRVRPALGGVSIGHFSITAGTLGCVVQARDGSELILSNNHVLANEYRGAEGDPILQPGPFDGGRTDRDAIARLQAWVTLKKDEANIVDAAVAAPYAATDVAEDVLGIGRLAGAEPPQVGMSVRKAGRTTRLTQGTVMDVDVTLRVQYRHGSLIFTDQAFIAGERRSFSSGGDSGSVIVSENRKAVGLLFAGSPFVTVACKMPNVEKALGISVG